MQWSFRDETQGKASTITEYQANKVNVRELLEDQL